MQYAESNICIIIFLPNLNTYLYYSQLFSYCFWNMIKKWACKGSAYILLNNSIIFMNSLGFGDVMT